MVLVLGPRTYTSLNSINRKLIEAIRSQLRAFRMQCLGSSGGGRNKSFRLRWKSVEVKMPKIDRVKRQHLRVLIDGAQP